MSIRVCLIDRGIAARRYFLHHYSNPDFAPYQATNACPTNVRSTNVRLLRSRAWVRTLYLFYKCSTSREVVALPNDLLI
jgi:hypothetical protein